MEKREKRLLTVKEVADYLQVNQTTIYRLLRRSEIPAFKVGGDWRFNIESIEAWRLSADAGSTPTCVPAESYNRPGEQVSSLSPMDALDMPAALVRLYQTISQMIAPIAELHATIPLIKRIARAIDDKRDASGEIARLYEGEAIPFRTHAQNLAEFAPLPFAVVNRKRRLVSFNDAYCRLFGFSPKQLRAAVLTDLVDEADQERFTRLNRQLLTGEVKSGGFVGRRVTADGSQILIRSQAWVVGYKPSSKPEYAAAIMERVATTDEALDVFARGGEDLSKRRERLLARG